MLGLSLPMFARAEPVRVVGEAGAYVGAIRSSWGTNDTGVQGSETLFVSGLRALLAARFEPSPGQAYQLGFVFDLMNERKAVGGIGLQLHADFLANRCWRIGGRAAASLSTYDSRLGAPDDTNGVDSYAVKRHGYLLVLGAQARHRYGALELDMVRTEDWGLHYSRAGVGVLAGASLTEKAGAYALGAGAAGSAIVLVLAWLALRDVKYSD